MIDSLTSFDSSPGHDVDDELMYGSGSTKKTKETSSEIDAQKARSTPSGAEGTATQSSTAPASGLASSMPSKVQHNASTTSIRSGVLGSDHQDSKMTSGIPNTRSAADPSNNPTSYPTGAHPKDFAAQGSSQASSAFDRSRDEAVAVPGQTTMSSSYPRGPTNTSNEPRSHPSAAHPTDLAIRSHPQANPGLAGSRNERGIVGGQTNVPGAQPSAGLGNTSRALDHEYTNPTTHRQPDSTVSGRQAGLAGGAALAAAGYAGTRDDSRNTTGLEERSPNAGGMAMDEGSQSQSAYSMPGQFPMSDPYNPYSSSHLDPRVDPYSASSRNSNPPAIGTATTTGRDPTSRSDEYGSSMDNSGLSGTKTTARPLDGPKGTSQPLSGHKGTAAPLPGPKGTSETFGEKSYQTGPDAAMGASGVPGHPTKTPFYDAVTARSGSNSGVGSPMVASDRSDFDRAADSGVGNPSIAADRSEPTRTADFGMGNAPTTAGRSGPTRAGDFGVSNTPTAVGRSEPTHAADSGFGTSAIDTPEHDSHKKEKSGLLGAIGLGSHGGKSREHDGPTHGEPSRAGVAGSTTAAGRSEPPYPIQSNVRTSDTVVREDDDQKKHRSGLLGAIGIGSHAKKSHTDDADKPSHASVASPTIADRAESTQGTDSGVRTSETFDRDDGDHKGKKGGLLGALGLGSHGTKSRTHHDDTSHDQASHGTLHDPTPSTGRAEPSHVTGSDARTSDHHPEDDSHKARNAGILGAIGLGGLAAKKHGEDHPERPTGTSRESTPTTAYPPGISLGDKPYPEAPVGSHANAPTRAHDSGMAPVGGYAAAPTRAHDSGAAPTQSGYQPSTTTSPTNTQPRTGTGVMTGPSTTTPGSTSMNRPEEDHTARNAAIGGAAAVGAGAVGAQQYSLHQAKEEAEERLKTDRAHQKAQEESQKAAEKEQKLHDKALAKGKSKPKENTKRS